MKKINKPLLITGTMRVGTTWTARALKINGIEVKHEDMGKDGCVSWFFSLDAPSYPTSRDRPTRHANDGRRDDYNFDTIIHLVRDPLKTIGSMCSIMLRKEQEWLVENKIIQSMEQSSKLLRMMQAWVGINAEVERIADYRMRLEDWTTQQRLWDKLGRRMGRKLTLPNLAVKNASRGTWIARKITFADLTQVDAPLSKQIKKMARRYGYPL